MTNIILLVPPSKFIQNENATLFLFIFFLFLSLNPILLPFSFSHHLHDPHFPSPSSHGTHHYGCFSMKSTYELHTRVIHCKGYLSERIFVASYNVPQCIQCFLWLTIRDGLMTNGVCQNHHLILSMTWLVPCVGWMKSFN